MKPLPQYSQYLRLSLLIERWAEKFAAVDEIVALVRDGALSLWLDDEIVVTLENGEEVYSKGHFLLNEQARKRVHASFNGNTIVTYWHEADGISNFQDELKGILAEDLDVSHLSKNESAQQGVKYYQLRDEQQYPNPDVMRCWVSVDQVRQIETSMSAQSDGVAQDRALRGPKKTGDSTNRNAAVLGAVILELSNIVLESIKNGETLDSLNLFKKNASVPLKKLDLNLNAIASLISDHVTRYVGLAEPTNNQKLRHGCGVNNIPKILSRAMNGALSIRGESDLDGIDESE